jgi:hypothetical protein
VSRKRVLPESRPLTVYQPVRDREALEALALERRAATGTEVRLGEVTRDALQVGLAARRFLARVVQHLRAEEARAWGEDDLLPFDRGDRLRVVTPADADRTRILEEALALYGDLVVGHAGDRAARVEAALRADLDLPAEDSAAALGALARAARAARVEPEAVDPLDELERGLVD